MKAYYVKELDCFEIKSVQEREYTFQFEVVNCNKQTAMSRMYFTKESFRKNKITKTPVVGDILVIDKNTNFWIFSNDNPIIVVSDSAETTSEFTSKLKAK